MQIIRCPKRGHPHFEKVNGCPSCRNEPAVAKPMDMGDLFFIAIDTDPCIRNIFFPSEPINQAAEELEEVEAIQEVRRAVNAWLYT